MNRAARVLTAGFVLAVSTLAVAGTAPTAAQADSVRSKQWQLAALRIPEAHRLTKGKGITVAVVDTGVDPTQADITGNVLPGVDIFTGKPAVRGEYYTDYHGTSMAALIAGHGHGPNREDGILGIAPEAKILPIKITRPVGQGSPREISTGIDWALSKGADLISISLQSSTSDLIEDSIKQAWKRGVPVMVATGNTGPSALEYYNGAMPVAAVGRDGKGVSSLQQIALANGISAPGADIPAAREGGYYTSTGTSNCTAIAAGVMALIMAKFPDENIVQLYRRIRQTADDRGEPGPDGPYGYGVVNPVAALTTTLPPTPSPQPSAQSSAQSSASAVAENTSSVPVAVVAGGVGCLAVLLIGAIVGGFVLVARRV
ncbi:S8 family serine peptidase [Cryptosporangium phraense]|uniref:S8 family serine peptidase n=1 Tax=Cryptosporangium phraense TaxID=2593070 RepID=A0A545AR50_9ACTN|nr:S8 family serine peptidase [Cryptosporangium phraense]TQS43809.1 S8 family serine peptidase [Cryptosporangium phraense]